MDSDNPLLEPFVGYDAVYKDLFKKNAEKYFDELVKKANVEVDKNKTTVNEYKIKTTKINNLKKLICKEKGLKFFLIFTMVLFIISVFAIIIATAYEFVHLIMGVVVSIVSITICILFLLLIIKKINPKIKSFDELKCKLESESKSLLSTAWEQLAPLNAIYDWNIPGKLITKTIPIIECDEYFDIKKYHYFHDKFGLQPNTDKNVSTYYCMSGSILGNPFLVCKDFKQTWIQKQYDGYLKISWIEKIKTDKGYITVTRHQILHASVTRPAPSYNYQTYLVYGNDAAPNLKFYRSPSGVNGKDKKQIEKMVHQGVKKLDKKARKAVINNETYTRLNNDEFEVLFGGTNRNNEVEFRLLFTPLAQNNLLDIIKNPTPYGDDFYFEKNLRINYIQSQHSQYFDYYANPTKFVHYDVEYAKKNFVEYMTKFFKGIYFDLAPLMSIPLYQQTKTRDYIYGENFDTNISTYEHEAIANSFNIDYLKPDEAATPTILKTTFINKVGKADSVNIDAYAFDAQERVAYVPILGGDGYFHDVPVHWIEYVPVEKKSRMIIEEKNSSRYEFNNLIKNGKFTSIINRFSNEAACLYERGLFAILLNKEISNSDIDIINSSYIKSNTQTNILFQEKSMRECKKRN